MCTQRADWIDVRTAPDHFVVNIGDLLMRWTNDRWLSNLHRVVNPPLAGGRNGPRLSIAFFNHPNYDVLIECLAPPGQAKHPPVLCPATIATRSIARPASGPPPREARRADSGSGP